MADVKRHHIVPGTLVRWTIHGMGGDQVREGRVEAYIPAGMHPADVCPMLRDLPRSRCRFDMRPTVQDRYLVRVEWGKQFRYYAPRARDLERATAGKEG